MNLTIKAFLILLPALLGCKRDTNPITPDPTTPVLTEGAFVIDTLRLSGAIKVDTLTTSQATFISLWATYHFEGRPGSLDGISLSVRNHTLLGIFEPYTPTPIGSRRPISAELKDSSTFGGADSISVHVGFFGRFWERADQTTTVYGTFSDQDSLWVHLQR